MSNPQIEALAKAQPIIKRHVLFATGAGFIPIPIADIAAITAIQLDMVRQLCKLYGQDYNDSSGKAFVSAIAGTTLSRIAAHSVGSVFKTIPIIGAALGGITVAAFAGATTYAIGQVVAQHFASGGSIWNFDSEELREFYEDQFEKGAKVVKEWQEEAEDKIEEMEEDIQDAIDEIFEDEPIDEKASKLTKLEELKNAGLVTDTEYKRIKKRILKNQ